MGNELKIMLGSGIVIILSDYFKMIGEETRKNSSLITNIIKCSLLSLGVTIIFILFDLYGYNPHLYREFSENELNTYSTIFFANIVFFLGFNSLFNWLNRFLVKYVYKFKAEFQIKGMFYFIRLIFCLLLPLYFFFLTSNNRFKVLKQDIVVTDNSGKKYNVKENTTFDFIYKDTVSKNDKNKKMDYETDESLFILKKDSEIKLLKGSSIYPLDEIPLEYDTKDNKTSTAIYTLSGESVISLNTDEVFTLQEDAKISLGQQNEYKSTVETLFYILCFLQVLYNLIKFLYWTIIPSINSKNKSIDDAWELSKHVVIHTSKDMLENVSQNNSYNLNSFLEDKQTFYNRKYQVPEIKCKTGDIIVDCKKYEATIVSKKNEGKTDLSADFLLLRINDNSIRSDYLLYIIQNHLKNNTDRKVVQKDLIDELSEIILKLPSKNYQKLVGQEYKMYVQKELFLEEHLKNVFEESKQENVG